MQAAQEEKTIRIRPFVPTLLACTLVLLLASTPVVASLVLALIPFVFVWLLFSVVLAVRRPVKRVPLLIQLGLWAVTCLGVYGLFEHHLHKARARGDQVVQAVQHHRTQHGVWPKTMAEAGISDDMWRTGRLGYVLSDQGAPSLFYRSPIWLFDTVDYNFEHRRWDVRPD